MNSFMSFILISIFFGTTIAKLFKFVENTEAHWAVLVAGSKGYVNYRHQSDVCHSYNILINNGMDPDKIIVLAYDDIANSSENPFPGQIFNKPDPNGNGVNVYKNCTIDYRGKDVNPETFLDVLNGRDISYGSKKTLKSTSTDNVFVYFSDHGATGLIGFPSSYLYADDLLNTLNHMSDSKSFNKLVFYLEACESGSMFANLANNTRIYAITAANAEESSWATYCRGSENKINNKSVGTCLGDEFSVNFLEDNEKSVGLNETLSAQFDNVEANTHGFSCSEIRRYILY